MAKKRTLHPGDSLYFYARDLNMVRNKNMFPYRNNEIVRFIVSNIIIDYKNEESYYTYFKDKRIKHLNNKKQHFYTGSKYIVQGYLTYNTKMKSSDFLSGRAIPNDGCGRNPWACKDENLFGKWSIVIYRSNAVKDGGYVYLYKNQQTPTDIEDLIDVQVFLKNPNPKCLERVNHCT